MPESVLAALSLVTRKNSRHPLLVLGLVALGIIMLTWRIVPRLAGEEALTISQAAAIRPWNSCKVLLNYPSKSYAII